MKHLRVVLVGLAAFALPAAMSSRLAAAQPSPAPPAPPAPPTPPAPPAPPDAVAPPPPVEPAPPPAPMPASEAKSDKPTVAVRYDKGLLFTSDDDAFAMKLALRTQFRAETLRPTEDGAEFTSRMTIPRARLQLEGHVFGDAHRYKLEFAAGDRQGFAFIKDLYFEQVLAGDKVVLRGGQWKLPFNRQEIVSDFGSSFNERANTADFVEGGRDVGVAIHNDYEKSPRGLEWVAGLFNSFKGGTDRPTVHTACSVDAMDDATCTSKVDPSTPGDWGPAAVVRVGWNHGKIKGYSEGDLEGGPLRVAIAANYKVDLALSTGAEKAHAAGIDLMLKIAGFDFLGAAFMVKKGEADPQFAATAQAGYFVTPKHAQVAARFSYVPNRGNPDRKDLEMRAAFNYYFHGHSWKIATDVGALKTTGTGALEDKPDLQARAMAQLTF